MGSRGGTRTGSPSGPWIFAGNWSALSNVVRWDDPLDTAPPATPANVVAGMPSDGGVPLSWTPGAEPDLAGYHVWRALDPSTAWSRLGSGLVQDTTFVDTSVARGCVQALVRGERRGPGRKRERAFGGFDRRPPLAQGQAVRSRGGSRPAYPNPAHQHDVMHLPVDVPAAAGDARLEIVDAANQVVRRFELRSGATGQTRVDWDGCQRSRRPVRARRLPRLPGGRRHAPVRAHREGAMTLRLRIASAVLALSLCAPGRARDRRERGHARRELPLRGRRAFGARHGRRRARVRSRRAGGDAQSGRARLGRDAAVRTLARRLRGPDRPGMGGVTAAASGRAARGSARGRDPRRGHHRGARREQRPDGRRARAGPRAHAATRAALRRATSPSVGAAHMVSQRIGDAAGSGFAFDAGAQLRLGFLSLPSRARTSAAA